MMQNNLKNSVKSSRNGVSIIELFGCVAALGGGLILGLMYLGIDLKAASVEAVQFAESNGIDLEYFNSDETTSEVATTEENLEENATTEIPANEAQSDAKHVSPSSEGSTTSSTSVPEEQGGEDATLSESTDAIVEVAESRDPAEATAEFWQQFTQTLQEEAKQRNTVVSNAGDWQLYDYLNHRKQLHEKVVETLEHLDDTSVDAKLLLHAQRVLTWHRSGAKLYGRAVELLTDSPTSSLNGPSAQSWQSAATQHRMEEKLLAGKHSSLVSYLNHSFESKAPFAP